MHLKGRKGRLHRIGMLLRRPEALAALPAMTLLGYWMGGEVALVILAIGVPILLAAAGTAFRGGAPHRLGSARQSGPVPGLSLRPAAIEMLDTVLQNQYLDGVTTGCLVLQFDDSDLVLQRHGRAAEAEVLTRSAERVCGVLRAGDVVAQLGVGGLAVVLSPVRRLDLETMIQVAARLQTAVSSAISVGAARIYVTCSVGFCMAERSPEPTGEALLDAAQVAADEARCQGPGAIRAWSSDMARTRADRDAIRDKLEAALDSSQIRPWFQPQLCTDTGRISGFEALARWHHPEKGVLPPSEFLPAIDEAGLSDRLGEVILYHALQALSQWDKAGFEVPSVAVNFSLSELRNPRLVEKLKWELDRFDLAPSRLTVEVLETVIADTQNDVVVANIAALAELGCGVDLDDFGTGHASITSIRRFSVRRLKVDRSFVTRVDEDREQQKMVAAILSLAERMGLDTLAEGVETPAEHAMLAQLGCRHVQGFGIGRPMPLEATADWIARAHAKIGKTPLIGSRAR